jgi:hypothetical protein
MMTSANTLPHVILALTDSVLCHVRSSQCFASALLSAPPLHQVCAPTCRVSSVFVKRLAILLMCRETFWLPKPCLVARALAARRLGSLTLHGDEGLSATAFEAKWKVSRNFYAFHSKCSHSLSAFCSPLFSLACVNDT